MHKKIMIFVLLITFSSNINFAQYGKKIEKYGGLTRIMSMGNSPFIIDPHFITQNPAWAASYDDFLYGNLGASIGNDFGPGGSGQFVYTNFRLNRYFTMGGYLSRQNFPGFAISNLDPFDITGQINDLSGLLVIEMDNNVSVLLTYSSGTHDIGVGIAYTGTSNQDIPASGQGSEALASQIGINAGYLGRLTRTIRFSFSAYLMFPNVSREEPGQTKSKFSQTIIGISSRMFFNISTKVSLVPIFSFLSSSGTADIGSSSGTTSTDLISNKRIRAGFGVVFAEGDILVSIGPSIEFASTVIPAEPQVAEQDNSEFSFPIWNLGAEWKLLDWFIARMGYSVRTKKVTTQSSSSATSKTEEIRTVFDPIDGGFTLGVGFNLGQFYLDATINEDILRQGLNNIGGGGATFAYISAGLAF